MCLIHVALGFPPYPPKKFFWIAEFKTYFSVTIAGVFCSYPPNFSNFQIFKFSNFFKFFKFF